MSTPSSIQIPKVYETRQHSVKDQSPMSSSSSTYSSSPQTPASTNPSSKAAQKQKAVHERRPSLLSPAISKSEATTINIGDPDAPRLISYLSSSQGFAWNPEIFLPSYIDVDYTPLENRQEPVVEITVTDDERRKWIPDAN